MIFIEKANFNHHQNRMKNEGDIIKARDYFFKKKNKNLFTLLENRYSWMNKFISEGENVLELGSGASLLKNFINHNIKTSDFNNNEFLDFKNIDACETGFDDNSFDRIISSNLIHHIAYPLKHFEEVNRILKKGGTYIIQDIHCSVMTKLAIILMKHEGFDFTKNIYDRNLPVNDPKNPWSANIAVPNLIFDDFKKFNQDLKVNFEMKYKKYSEFLLFLNSGGVIAKTYYLPLNKFLNNFVKNIDKIFSYFYNIFPMQISVVLEKK